MLDLDIRKTLHAGTRRFELNVRVQTSSQRVVIFGPSGAGKSLTLQALAGLMRPDAGHICLNGQTLFDSARGIHLAPQARRMGYVFQDYALFPHLTVRQNIGFGLARGWLNPRAHRRLAPVDHWLDTFELQAMAHQYPDELSGGQRQRTALARALAAQPRALLLDEPFAALDTALRRTMRHELDALQRQLQIPMVLITHDPDDVAMLGEHVVTLNNGQPMDLPPGSG